MKGITEADVYNIMSYSNWKTAIEIKHEIIEKKRISDLEDILNGLALVHKHLRSLVGQEYAEKRQRPASERKLAMRGGRPVIEYHLTEKGMSQSIKYVDDIIAQSQEV